MTNQFEMWNHLTIAIVLHYIWLETQFINSLIFGPHLQALLQHSAPKLLLIWTRRTSTSLIQADPPLPPVVQRALKVLPSLKWTSDKPAGATSNFLRSLKKALPKHWVETRPKQVVWQKRQSSHSFKCG